MTKQLNCDHPTIKLLNYYDQLIKTSVTILATFNLLKSVYLFL